MNPENTVPTLWPAELRCEYRDEPLGIDISKPRFTWLLESSDPLSRGQRQSAYQILVASSEALLNDGEGDLWNSGRVQSGDTVNVEYAGDPLSSSMECFWKVRVWNAAGEPGPWSASSRFSMGLLEAGEWKAQWIGYDAPADGTVKTVDADRVELDGCQWIWTPDVTDATELLGPRYFRKWIELPSRKKITSAVLMISACRRFQFFINGRSIACGLEQTQWARAFDIAVHLRTGKNLIAIEAGMEEPNETRGIIGRLQVEFDDSSLLQINLDRTWRCTARHHQGWSSPEFDEHEWRKPIEVCAFGSEPWGTPKKLRLTLPPAAYLRKSLTIDRPVKRAFVHASALGVYELHLNGRVIGDACLAPGWTDFRKRVHYQTHDVTYQLQQGENVLGIILADGWYAGFVGYQGRRNWYGDKPRCIAQLHIEFQDGTQTVIGTDESWRASRGPVQQADLFMGCQYDARLEQRGWDDVAFSAAVWHPVDHGDRPRAMLVSHPGTPVTRTDQISAQAVSEPEPGIFVVDFGQNLVGVVRIKLRGERGTRVVLRYAEMINPDGSLYTTSLRGARATDTYICRGDGDEVFEPSFTFHGFRYVEVRGLRRRPAIGSMVAVVMHSAMERTGWFECSDQDLNQLFSNILWSQKGNYLEVPTDCPQRDERLGWTGDAQVFMPTAAMNFDVASFFAKWLVDLVQDSQLPNGAFASVAPDVLDGMGAGSAAWSDAGIICTYFIYRFYDDRRIIERHYSGMARFIEYLCASSDELIREQGIFGDWLHLGGSAHGPVIGTAYFEYVCRLMSEMALAISKNDDAEKYIALAEAIRKKFIESFVCRDGSILLSGQTGYALAFTMNLLPEPLADRAAQRFAEEFQKHGGHLATGFVGTPRLLPALSAAGHTDMAYQLLLTNTFPGWLFQIRQGATTMWERWDGFTPERGFQDPGMNSFNHYAFGSVGQWLYQTVAGIESDGPGFSRITIDPQPGGGLTHASAAYKSIRGRIESSWEMTDQILKITIRVPLNTQATVCIRDVHPETARESDAPLHSADGVQVIRVEQDRLICRVHSGRYTFTARKLPASARSSRVRRALGKTRETSDIVDIASTAADNGEDRV
jgi:alpha-L-rhamnosidase